MPPRDVRSVPDEDVLDIIEDDELEFPVPPTTARPATGDRPSSTFDDGLADEDLGDHEGELGHTGHKKIPTWQDAVAILIDANMAARTNSPDRGHRGRRGGSRGR